MCIRDRVSVSVSVLRNLAITNRYVFMFRYCLSAGDTAMPGGLHARLCHAFPVRVCRWLVVSQLDVKKRLVYGAIGVVWLVMPAYVITISFIGSDIVESSINYIPSTRRSVFTSRPPRSRGCSVTRKLPTSSTERASLTAPTAATRRNRR